MVSADWLDDMNKIMDGGGRLNKAQAYGSNADYEQIQMRMQIMCT